MIIQNDKIGLTLYGVCVSFWYRVSIFSFSLESIESCICCHAHVGVFLFILECFNNSTFFNVVCVSW